MSNALLELRRLLSTGGTSSVGKVVALSAAFLTVDTASGRLVVPNTGGCGLGSLVLLQEGTVIGRVGVSGTDYGVMYPV